MTLEAFRDGAAFYDALFDPAARGEREGPFLRRMLEEAPGGRVVDIACGTGFHARLLAEMGATVDAFDLSEAMLARARHARSHPRIRYVAADMSRLNGGPWDLALCLGNSLALLPDAAALRETFEAVARSLAPGGRFVVQVLDYARHIPGKAAHSVFTKDVDGVRVTAVKNLVPADGVTFLNLGFFAQAGGETVRVGETAVLRHLGERVLRETATAVGLQTVGVFGGLTGEPLNPEQSTDVVMVLVKPLSAG